MSHLDEMPLTSSYARVLLAQFAGHDGDLLVGSGLTGAALMAAERISVRQQLAIFRNAARITERIAEPGWALRYAAGISAAMHGAMGVAAVSAPTVREGLAVLARFARTRDPYMDFRLFELPDELGLEFVTGVIPLGDLEQPMIEICLSFVVAMLRVMAGAEAAGCRLMITAAAPDHAALYGDFLPVPCMFGADRNAVIVPRPLAGARSLVADAALHRDALAACGRELAALGAIFPDETRVRWLIEASPAAPPSFSDVARMLGRSERALSRQLAAAGTSFRQIRDECNITQAKALLQSSHLPLVEIAARTGFDDAANFSRAFRRVTGMAPGAYRRSCDAPVSGSRLPEG